jgi:hypothetical protein
MGFVVDKVALGQVFSEYFGFTYSTPTSAEVKKTWVYTSTPPCVFMA